MRCSNVLLDAELNAKLADFGGSSLDGSPLLVGVTASHECPGSTLSIEGDIFALGSTFYEIMTGQSPYATLSDEEIATSYAQSQFPDVSFMGPIGHVILNCWLGRYHVAEAVDAELNGTCNSIHPIVNCIANNLQAILRPQPIPVHNDVLFSTAPISLTVKR